MISLAQALSEAAECLLNLICSTMVTTTMVVVVPRDERGGGCGGRRI